MSWLPPLLLILAILPLFKALDCYDSDGENGVDCLSENFYCSVSTEGAALCVYTAFSCYNTKCQGAGDSITTYVDCDQTYSTCGIDEESGMPTCNPGHPGLGTNCTGGSEGEVYCGSDPITGAAICEVNPPYMCYNNKCAGSGEMNTTYIPCDQSKNICEVDEEGEPSCVPPYRGIGINCTIDTSDPKHDEYYCENDPTTGAAECVYPPKYDCYDTSCTGIDEFDYMTIACDQSENRCGLTELGEPICINTTRGNGVYCSGEKFLDYDCNNDTRTGAAICVAVSVWSCYSQFCQGTGNKNTSWVSCDGAKNRCGLAQDGSPVCVAGHRGSGVNCNKERSFYCSHKADDPTTAICKYPEEHSCYNTKCHGIYNNSHLLVDCPQDHAHCDVLPSGLPLCVPDSRNTGDGILCMGKYSCSADDTTGDAVCNRKRDMKDLWVVLAVALAVVVIMITICVVKRRSKSADRQFLLAPSSYPSDG